MGEKESAVKKMLRKLCLSYGCSYGVFWRFDPRNYMLLTMEDAYYDEHSGIIVDSMRLQAHILGEGKIGKAASDGKHRWISVNSSSKEQNVIWEDSDLSLQFLSGMKTIVVLPLELRGVVQFGFTKEILEMPELLDQARRFFLENDTSIGVSSAGTSSLNSDVDFQNGTLVSLISSQNSFQGNSNMSSSWTNTAENTGYYPWMLDSLPFPGVNSDGNIRSIRNQSGDGELVIDPNIGSDFSTSLEVFQGQFDAHGSQSLFDAYQINTFSHWLDDDTLSGIPCKQSSGLSHSPLHDALNLSQEEKPSVVTSNKDGLLGNKFGIECLKDVMSPIEAKGNPLLIDNNMCISECISGVEGTFVAAPRKGLFSELGLEHLLRDGGASTSSVAKSCTMDPINNGAQTSHFGSLKDNCKPKQGELWIDDSHSMDAKSCLSGVRALTTRRPEESAKFAKKRAKPGESTRPRPKDRQMISERIKELRDLVPNGAKLSIDALLGHTVKHMIFLQNVTKHADKLKKLDQSKGLAFVIISYMNDSPRSNLNRRSNSLVQKENMDSICSGSNISRDVTWAYEVEGQNLFCPIIVEDLGHPGQMLIEMLCEERGYFLELADLVRGLGLTIIKGVMESRDKKIWARYIVEGNRDVTRMDVFVSLMQLLQGSATRTINNGGPSCSNYQQHRHLVPLPI